MTDRIVAIAEQPRPGIDPYRITVRDDRVTCPDKFHDTGEGGTEPASVGGGWQLSHCARRGCDGADMIHAALFAHPETSTARCDGCYRSDFDGTWWCDNCDQWPCICVEETS